VPLSQQIRAAETTNFKANDPWTFPPPSSIMKAFSSEAMSLSEMPVWGII
jgi:hypothetical protein